MSRLVACLIFLVLGCLSAGVCAQECLPSSSSLIYAAAVADGVVLCHDEHKEGAAPKCLKATLGKPDTPYAAGAWERPSPPASNVRTVDNKAVEVCEPNGGCRTFDVGLLDTYAAADSVAVVNRKIGRLAVLTGAQEEGRVPPRVNLYNLKTGKLLRSRPMTFERPAADSDYRCGALRWLGDTLLISTDVCAGPGGQSWLARGRDLKPIGLLGTRGMNTYAARPVHVRGNRWAFVSAFSRHLVVQDVVRGKVVRNISLEGTLESEDEDGNLAVAMPDGRLAVVLGASNVGDIVVFGGGKVSASRHAAPRCPPAPKTE